MKYLVPLLLIFISMNVAACQPKQQMEVNADRVTNEVEIDALENLQVEGDIVKVHITTLEEFINVNTDTFTDVDDNEMLEIIKQAITKAVEQPGIVNMANADYDLQVRYDNGSTQGYRLWLGEKGKGSTLMRTDDTHTIYTVESSMTDQLIRIVE